MLRTLLFGGSFDPVHHGHLITALFAAEALAAQRLVLVPTNVSPHKVPGGVIGPSAGASGTDRVAMLRLAVEGNAGDAKGREWDVEDLEIRRPGPSYTIDTVESLQARYAADTLVLLMGADQLAKLHTWHRVRELLDRVELAVLRRPGSDIEPGLGGVRANLGDAVEARLRAAVLDSPLIDISATQIRARVRAGLPIRYLVPDAVAAYIHQHGLYQ